MSKLALVLTGGGARAAYQVGVLKGIAQLLPRGANCPFQVITGTSAGAVSAIALALDPRIFAAPCQGSRISGGIFMYTRYSGPTPAPCCGPACILFWHCSLAGGW